MKTAISVPDDIFRRVEKMAAELRMNRSEFFSVAAERYLAELDAASVTRELNAAIARSAGASAAEDAEFARFGRARLAAATEGDEW